jgi:hypothetical protein
LFGWTLQKWSTLKIDDWSLSEERVSCLVLRTKSLQLLPFAFLSKSFISSSFRLGHSKLILLDVPLAKVFLIIFAGSFVKGKLGCAFPILDSLVLPHLRLLKTLSLQFEASRPRTLLFKYLFALDIFSTKSFFLFKVFRLFCQLVLIRNGFLCIFFQLTLTSFHTLSPSNIDKPKIFGSNVLAGKELYLPMTKSQTLKRAHKNCPGVLFVLYS